MPAPSLERYRLLIPLIPIAARTLFGSALESPASRVAMTTPPTEALARRRRQLRQRDHLDVYGVTASPAAGDTLVRAGWDYVFQHEHTREQFAQCACRATR